MAEIWSHSEQDGSPGHGIQAQVFGPDGKCIAYLEPTDDPALATARARKIAAVHELYDVLGDLVLEISMGWNIGSSMERALAALAKARGGDDDHS